MSQFLKFRPYFILWQITGNFLSYFTNQLFSRIFFCGLGMLNHGCRCVKVAGRRLHRSVARTMTPVCLHQRKWPPGIARFATAAPPINARITGSQRLRATCTYTKDPWFEYHCHAREHLKYVTNVFLKGKPQYIWGLLHIELLNAGKFNHLRGTRYQVFGLRVAHMCWYKYLGFHANLFVNYLQHADSTWNKQYLPAPRKSVAGKPSLRDFRCSWLPAFSVFALFLCSLQTATFADSGDLFLLVFIFSHISSTSRLETDLILKFVLYERKGRFKAIIQN